MADSAFGEVIYAYTREQAIADGVLVDVSEMAKEAGFKFPVAITAAVHADVNNIPKGKAYQSYGGRLWDVLFMSRVAANRSSGGGSVLVDLIMHVGRKSRYQVKMNVGPGDNGEGVITIMQPHED